jgi:hypothetical protein
MTKQFEVPGHWSNEKNHELKEVSDKIPYSVRKAVDFWFAEIDSYDTSIYNYLKCATELATYLKWKNIPFIFTSAETEPSSHDVQSFNDTSIDSLYKIHKTMPVINFNGKGFYTWAKEQSFDFGIDHPKDQAHNEAVKLVLNQVANFL